MATLLFFKLEQLIGASTPEHKKEIHIVIHEKGFIGLDVGKFEIFVFISISEVAFSVPNTATGHAALQSKIGQPNGQIIALEPTGGYEWEVWETLDKAGYDVRQISAAHVRAFARATGANADICPIFRIRLPRAESANPLRQTHIAPAPFGMCDNI